MILLIHMILLVILIIVGGFEGTVTLPSLGRKRKSHEFLSENEVIDRASSDRFVISFFTSFLKFICCFFVLSNFLYY